MITKEQVKVFITKGNKNGVIQEGKFKGANYVLDDKGITNYICDVTGDGYEKYLYPVVKDNKMSWYCKKAFNDYQKEKFKDKATNKIAKATGLLIEIGSQFEDTYKMALKTAVASDSRIPEVAKPYINLVIDKLDSEFDKRIALIDPETFTKNIIDKLIN